MTGVRVEPRSFDQGRRKTTPLPIRPFRNVELASICFGLFGIGFAELVEKSNSEFSISLASSLSFSAVLVVETFNLARYLSLTNLGQEMHFST